jgi:transcriptional regulator with XRE-family HTH domain
MTHPLNLSDLGRRIRAARLARRLTLEEVVSRTDFTVSWLSKLENGQLSPSLDGLVKIADVLECGVETLVEGLSVPPQFVVVRQGQGTSCQHKPGRSGIVVENLADQWRNRRMHPTILHISGTGNRNQPDNHDGERFLYVLDGAVKINYGDEVIQLAAGDSIYIYAAIPHSIVPVGRTSARVLSVSCEAAENRHPGSVAAHDGDGRADAAPATRGGRRPSPDRRRGKSTG